MIIAKNRIFSKYSSRKEKISSIVVNIKLLSLFAIAFAAYLYPDALFGMYGCAAYLILFFFTIMSYAGICDFESSNVHIGSNNWYASIINFNGNAKHIQEFIYGMVPAAFLFCLLFIALIGMTESYFEIKIVFIFIEILLLSVLSVVIVDITGYSKVSEEEIYLIDKVEVFDEDQKNFFKATAAEKIRKNGYVTRDELHRVFKIINKQYLKTLSRQEKEKELAKKNIEKDNEQQNYQNLLNEYKKPLAYIVKEK